MALEDLPYFFLVKSLTLSRNSKRKRRINRLRKYLSVKKNLNLKPLPKNPKRKTMGLLIKQVQFYTEAKQ